MKKTILIKLVIFAMLITTVFSFASCYSFADGGLVFVPLEEGGYAAMGVAGKGRFYSNFSVEIPSEYNGQPVVALAPGAFLGYTSLMSITLPDTITSIGENAFSGCTLLKRIEIPDSVTYIGEGAFMGCTSLTEVDLPDNLNKVSAFAFSDCPTLQVVKLPDSVKVIDRGAFENCKFLKNINLPDGLETIGERAFNNCSWLKTIIIPDTVTSVGEYAFRDCTGLEELYFGNSVGDAPINCIKNCTSLKKLTLGKTAVLHDYKNEYVSLSSLEELRIYSECSFFGNTFPNLKILVLDENACFLGNWNFQDCTKLESITLAGKIEYVPDYLFSGCTSLKTVIFGDHVIQTGIGAFDNCTLISDITIGAKLEIFYELNNSVFESVKNVTFKGNVPEYYEYNVCFPNLENVTFENPPYHIPDAFKNIPSLKFREYRGGLYLGNKDNPYLVFCDFNENYSGTTLTIHNDTEIIAENALQRVDDYFTKVELGKSIKYVGYSTNIGLSNEFFSEYEGGYYLGTKDNPYYALIGGVFWQENSSLTVHPDTVVIGEMAFHYTESLESVVISDSVKYICNNAFSQCNNLKELNIGSSVEVIGNRAFMGCDALEEIVLPETVKYIDEYAFADCTSLVSLTIPGPDLYIHQYALYDCENLMTVYFGGTMSQWLDEVGIYIAQCNIYCSDGTIK